MSLPLRRHAKWLPALLLALSVALNLWQGARWSRLYTLHANQFKDGLHNTAIYLGWIVGEKDPGERSLMIMGPMHAPRQITERGQLIEQMQAGDGVAGRVGYELQVFTNSVWLKHDLKSPEPGSRQNPLPPEEDLLALKQVYDVYVKHFSEAVILRGTAGDHQQALQAVHAELNSLGLIRLLPKAFLPYMGL